MNSAKTFMPFRKKRPALASVTIRMETRERLERFLDARNWSETLVTVITRAVEQYLDREEGEEK